MYFLVKITWVMRYYLPRQDLSKENAMIAELQKLVIVYDKILRLLRKRGYPFELIQKFPRYKIKKTKKEESKNLA